GRLIAVAEGPTAASDARHVAVEFVHPVIVGKRALPALALTGEGLAEQVALLSRGEDMVMAFGAGPGAGTRSGSGAGSGGGAVAETVARARERGCLTIGFGATGAEFELQPQVEDPFIGQEIVETSYHVLWELVHVFFEHRGLLGGRAPRRRHDAGASSFLYPFLDEAETDLDAVLEDVRRSALMKAQEIAALREQTLGENREVLAAAAARLRDGFAAGGTLLALGNGGSATDAMDVVADFLCGSGDRRPRAALDLTADSGILTAIANDIGVEAIFARQVIAYGRAGDTLLALSTSGNSSNVIAALAQARRQRLSTIAMVGYDGGRIAVDGLADHVVVTRSEHIPRIQEAQASAYHALRALVG
ncbi:MAG: SIS domain-containing protein, partial [Solirubrobacteraceae bacterium]